MLTAAETVMMDAHCLFFFASDSIGFSKSNNHLLVFRSRDHDQTCNHDHHTMISMMRYKRYHYDNYDNHQSRLHHPQSNAIPTLMIAGDL